VEGAAGAQTRDILEGRLVFVALSDSGTPVPISARDTGPVA
jgi:hypothetical protein